MADCCFEQDRGQEGQPALLLSGGIIPLLVLGRQIRTRAEKSLKRIKDCWSQTQLARDWWGFEECQDTNGSNNWTTAAQPVINEGLGVSMLIMMGL